MDLKTSFFFYLAALACFILAASGEAWKMGRRTRQTRPPLLLQPLGLALAVFPTLWTTATLAW